MSNLGLAPPPTRRHELAEFIRHQRETTSPEAVGLQSNGHRRTPGLGPLTLHHLQSIPTGHPDLRLTQFVPADAATRAALARA